MVLMNKNLSFSLRGPDRMSEELATVLSAKGSWEFKSLFGILHANLRSKGWANGGEEMLRLRAHEKLQKFLQTGVVTKTGKEYTGVPKALGNFFKLTAELKAKVEMAIQNRATLQSDFSKASSTEESRAKRIKAARKVAA
jgi:hypothetical protein